MVVKLDRLARKATHNLAAFDLIESLGASLAIVAENIDTATTSGRLFRTMLAGMAEFERDSIVERMGSARYRKAQQGEWPGSPVPFGYKLAEDRRSFEIEKGEA
ncbi:MAG: recombinase family protein, partial [Actinomycetia bacterium]|nr:recombinase family protein [Actinomycetes bacterium]